MLTWLLSLAGLGGLGAALAFIPGAGPLALGWASKVLGIVRDNPWQAALISALLWGAYERHQHMHWRDYAHRLEAQGKANVTSLKAEKAATEKRQAETTRRINHETVTARDTALAAGRDYAAAHSIVRASPSPAPGQAGGSVPDVPAPTGGSQASGAEAAVVVPQWAIDACSLNSADLQEAVSWAKSVSQ